MPFNSFLNYPMSWKPERGKLKRPIYLSLAEQLEKDIAAGFLPPGTKLPPQRELADFLDINFTTVTRAYRICELKGLIYAVTGSGTFVAPNAAKSVTISSDDLAGSSIDLGFTGSFEQCNAMITDTAYAVMKKRQFAELLNYEYPTGMPHHKAAAVNWLNSLGVQTDTEHLAIASGTLNAITLTLLALFEPGNRIAVDTYEFVNFIELAKMYHLQLVPIAGDEEGMLPEELENQHRIKPLHGIFLSPSCCNPTTVASVYKGTIRSKPCNFGDFLRYPHSAYVQYASIVCLKNRRNSNGWSLRVVKWLILAPSRHLNDAYRDVRGVKVTQKVLK